MALSQTQILHLCNTVNAACKHVEAHFLPSTHAHTHTHNHHKYVQETYFNVSECVKTGNWMAAHTH